MDLRGGFDVVCGLWEELRAGIDILGCSNFFYTTKINHSNYVRAGTVFHGLLPLQTLTLLCRP
jgi:hypothetical protein